MTENEAIYCLKAESDRYSEVCEECPLYGKVGCDHCFEDAIDVAIKALEELQMYKQGGLCLIPSEVYKKQCEELDAYKEIGTAEDIQEVISFIDLDDEHGIIDDLELLNKYRLLGTVEEFKALKEKNVAKKPNKDEFDRFTCPDCGWIVSTEEYGGRFLPHCENCGRKIDWR